MFSCFLFSKSLVAQFPNNTYKPLSCEKFTDFKASVRKLLMLQISKYAPPSFEVTDDYMRWSKEKVKGNYWSDVKWVGTEAITVYYEYITDLKITKVRHGYEVAFKIPNEGHWIHLIYKSKDICIEAYSVLKCKLDSFKK